jgi:hypothetical protein
VAKNEDIFWAAIIIGAVIVWNLLQPTSVTTTSSGQPVAGAGVDPFDAGEYSVEALADAAGLGL